MSKAQRVGMLSDTNWKKLFKYGVIYLERMKLVISTDPSSSNYYFKIRSNFKNFMRMAYSNNTSILKHLLIGYVMVHKEYVN